MDVCDSGPKVTLLELSELVPYYKKYSNCLKVGHININSIRHKFNPLREALSKKMLDILCIQETKLDDTFPQAQFDVSGFKQYRQDYRSNEGGIMVFIRDDIAHMRRTDLEVNEDRDGRIETLVLEIKIKSEKWVLSSLYKQPKVKPGTMSMAIDTHINSCKAVTPNSVIVGDINLDVLKQKNCVRDTLGVQGFKNCVTQPTCFKGQNPTSIDAILTNVPKRVQGVECFDTGLSDFHHMVLFSTKVHVPARQPRKIIYRTYKKFDAEKYNHDLSCAPFHVGGIFDSIDDSYWYYETLLKGIIDEHAPLKCKTVRHNQVPYMNGQLRRAINYKNKPKRRFEKCKNSTNWELYRTQRNYVGKLQRQSLSSYLMISVFVLKSLMHSGML